MIIAGVDIGNSTTEVCLCEIKDNDFSFISDAACETTGLKGTVENVHGIARALELAVSKINHRVGDIDLIRLNSAAPVVGDTTMETITETIITDSTLIGHNPSTPAGQGVGKGVTLRIEEMHLGDESQPYLLVVNDCGYDEVARKVNESKLRVTGIILKHDEAVLVYNRLEEKIPIIDEVKKIEAIDSGIWGVIEVASVGQTIKQISNPYGLSKFFDLSAEETKEVMPVAKSLIGKKSGVVLHTGASGYKEKKLYAGKLLFEGSTLEVEVDAGAEAIMAVRDQVDMLDLKTDDASSVEQMLSRMKKHISKSFSIDDVRVRDILAIDTLIPMKVKGAMAGEVALEKAIAIAAMVKTDDLPMNLLSEVIHKTLGMPVEIAGTEAVMAAIGALTTSGTSFPMVVLDLGGGSTDAAILSKEGVVQSMHLAGAGNMITMLIDKELGLDNFDLAEAIKMYPLAKVTSLYSMTLENGDIIFSKTPLDPKYFGQVIVLESEYRIVTGAHTLEKIVEVRRRLKKEVFVTNALRALRYITGEKKLTSISSVVMVGGSALDFEIPELIQEALSHHNIIAGRGDIRSQGPRNAVATGLCMSIVERGYHE